MNILFDSAMPYAGMFFSDLGDAHPFTAGQLCGDSLRDVEVLLIRSTTRVDSTLLDLAPKLKFVGTATAGFDHIDVEALNRRGIRCAVASGCNAVSVAQYVLSALAHLSIQDAFSLNSKKVAIIGAGKVGSALSYYLNCIGVEYCLCDPPLADAGDPRSFVPLEQALECDIISLHTPLIKSGPYPTKHLFNAERLERLSKYQYLVNASRGAVIDNQSLLSLFKNGRSLNVVLDVWENEPDIETTLIPFTRLATAHIAGHSLEGKARGTEMLYEQFCAYKGEQATKRLSDFLPQNTDKISLDFNDPHIVLNTCLATYDISMDDRVFRTLMAQSPAFKQIRKSYPIRREYTSYLLDVMDEDTNNQNINVLKKLGFLIKD